MKENIKSEDYENIYKRFLDPRHGVVRENRSIAIFFVFGTFSFIAIDGSL